MRTSPFVQRAEPGFAVRFPGAQRDLLRSAFEYVAGHPSPEIRTGWDRDRLTILAGSLAEGERTYTVEELHIVHAVLLSVCNMFASEEAFHIRIGFFRENARAVADGLAKAVENAALRP
ncbi:hypothetical protein AB0I69_46555 [Streptomyces sp. NPDC050508]|uniref:hypothetical protein n=1 Tax=Streptomyces sp. NPDC050508 TaxID=3155405 RepID=UPI0034353A64